MSPVCAALRITRISLIFASFGADLTQVGEAYRFPTPDQPLVSHHKRGYLVSRHPRLPARAGCHKKFARLTVTRWRRRNYSFRRFHTTRCLFGGVIMEITEASALSVNALGLRQVVIHLPYFDCGPVSARSTVARCYGTPPARRIEITRNSPWYKAQRAQQITSGHM